MSTEKSGKNMKRVYVQFEQFNNFTAWQRSETEANEFARRFLIHPDLKPRNVIVVEGDHEVDVIFDATDEQVLSEVAERAPPHKKRRAKAKLEIAPGFKLHGWLSSLCPPTFKENVLDECLAEGTRLHQERLAAGDLKGARRVRWAMRWWMVRAVGGGFITGAFLLVGALRKSSD